VWLFVAILLIGLARTLAWFVPVIGNFGSFRILVARTLSYWTGTSFLIEVAKLPQLPNTFTFFEPVSILLYYATASAALGSIYLVARFVQAKVQDMVTTSTQYDRAALISVIGELPFIMLVDLAPVLMMGNALRAMHALR
jgi:hypothetical protein